MIEVSHKSRRNVPIHLVHTAKLGKCMLPALRIIGARSYRIVILVTHARQPKLIKPLLRIKHLSQYCTVRGSPNCFKWMKIPGYALQLRFLAGFTGFISHSQLGGAITLAPCFPPSFLK